jgi:hypothetical protein
MTPNLHALTGPEKPWLHGVTTDVSGLADALVGLEKAAPGQVAARRARGSKSRTTAAFFDEVAAALQFPPHFGENWDALHDSLCDLSWLPTAVVLCVTDSALLLADAPPDQLKRFLTVVTSATKHRNQPGKGKTPRPLHVVLHAGSADEAAARTRFEKAGVSWGGLG